MDRPVIVFACGDELRGDDAVALAAVEGLPGDVLERVDLRMVGALAPEHLTALAPGARIVILDAVVGPPPGQLVELDLAELGRAAATAVHSTHQLPLAQVVALAEVLRGEPVAGRFVGLGIASVSHGSGMSEPVAMALPALREAVARAVLALA